MLTSVEPGFMNAMMTKVAEPKIEFSFNNDSNGFQAYLDASMRVHESPNTFESFDNYNVEKFPTEKLMEKIERIFEVLPSLKKIMMKLFKTMDPNASDDSTKGIDDLFSTIQKKLLKIFAKTGLEKKNGDRAKNTLEGNDVLIKDIVIKALEEIKTDLNEKGIRFDEKKVDVFVKNIGSLLLKMAKAEKKKTVKTTGFKVNLKEIKIANHESLVKFMKNNQFKEKLDENVIDEDFLELSTEFNKILNSGVEMMKETVEDKSEFKTEKLQKIITDLSKVMGQKLVELEKIDTGPKQENNVDLIKKIVEIAKVLFKSTKQVKSSHKTHQAEKKDENLEKLVDDLMKVLVSEQKSDDMKSKEIVPAAVVAEVSEVIKQNIEKHPELFVSKQDLERVVKEVSEKIVTISIETEKSNFSARKKVLTETDLKEVKKDFRIDNQVKDEKAIGLNLKTFKSNQSEVVKKTPTNFDELAKKLNVKEVEAEVKTDRNESIVDELGSAKFKNMGTKNGEESNFDDSDENIISAKNNPGINMKSEEWKLDFQENKTTRKELMSEMRDKFMSKMDELKDGAIQFGKNRVKVKLNPENLGELKIELTMTEKGLVVKITSDRPEVRQMIEGSAAALKQSFSQKGLNLHEFVVSMKEDAFYQDQEQKNKWGSKKKSEDLDEEDEEAIEALDMDALREIFKSQKLKHGGIDYWI